MNKDTDLDERLSEVIALDDEFDLRSSRNQLREHYETVDDPPVVRVRHRDELPEEL